MPDGSLQIELTQGQYAYIDAIDADRILSMRWSAFRSGTGRWNARSGNKSTKTWTYMQKIILSDVEVDHIDGNPLNNRRSNLRPATRVQNQRNRRKQRKPATSRYKGVCLNRKTGKWIAYINPGGDKTLYLGSHRVEDDAARAYDEAARQHHGEFARLNFPKKGEQSALE